VWRERLQLLADDPQVKGIIVTIGDLHAGLPAIESLRRSLLAFRARQAPDRLSGDSQPLHILSGQRADTLMAPESAEFALHGLRTEATFLRAALEQMDVRPQFHHIAEYKSAANRLLYASMPEPQREMQVALSKHF
jgi:protease-4